ncbi:MAG: twin-arginine translocation signal domain-containing protein [Pirellulales bacterium]|nr:twin-arginine translocation signal domain-containing protein [Pirellulales bacterium]
MSSINRREFLEGAAVAGGMLLAGGVALRPLHAAEEAGWPALPTVKIHVVYVGLGGAWPKPEFDAKAEVEKFQKHFDGLAGRLGDVQFVGGELIPSDEKAAAALVPKLAGADALLIVHLAFGDGGPFLKLMESGLPTAIFSQPFSGHDWMYVPQWQKAGKRVILAATRDYADLDRLAALLRVPARMRQSRILLIGSAQGTAPARSAEKIRQKLGVEIVPVSIEQQLAAYNAVDPKEAQSEAEQYWLKPAKKIVEPSREEIVNSARLYLALKRLMVENRAQAVTSTLCMGNPCNACLAFSKLNDLGLVGACEGDVDSTLTMLLFGYAFAKPGFITDPLFDVSKNAMIHAHCVAPTRMDGPGGPRHPFSIRTHRDDNSGAAVEVELRLGQEITCAKLVNLDTMLLSAQKIVEIPDFDDRGCRTQCTAQVADARAMLANWGSGILDGEGMMTQLHRVVFYGNHVPSVRDLCQLLGVKIVMEG